MHTRFSILAVSLGALLSLSAYAEPPRTLPANSLAFHLQSLARTPTRQEREVIEAALTLMQRHRYRTDYPLRSVKYDDAKREWVLLFDEGKPDAAFWVFLQHKDATSFEIRQLPSKPNDRTKVPTERKKR